PPRLRMQRPLARFRALLRRTAAMNRQSLDKLRLDRRLLNRRGWMRATERARALEELPDVSHKATTLGAESGEANTARDESPAPEGAPQHVALAGLALATTVLVSYTKARAELVIEHFEIGLLERAERVVILAAGALSGLLVPALWIIAIGSAITAGQRIALA